MKILILGNKGMLGQELMKVFREGNDLFGWDKEEIDITDKDEVNEKIAGLKPDVIINAAAYTDVDGCETHKDLCMKVNGYAAGEIAKVAQNIGAVVVHYSTDYIFDGKKEKGYREDDQPDKPLNVYGESKLLGEILLKNNCKKYYLIRTSWLYGQGGKNFVDTMLKLAETKRDISVVNDQFGKPTYAHDLAVRTRELIDNAQPHGIYHLTNETGESGISWYDFAKKTFEISGLEIKARAVATDEFPRPAQRPKYSILVNTKLPLSRFWHEALKEYLYK